LFFRRPQRRQMFYQAVVMAHDWPIWPGAWTQSCTNKCCVESAVMDKC
jgi:hypothetical protein